MGRLGCRTLFFVATAHWLWLVGSIAALFYLGIVGSKLHPLQSARELARGPTAGEAAAAEAASLPDDVKTLLVGHACTRVALLLGSVAAFVSIAGLRFPWYVGLGCAWSAALLVGAALKLGFGTVSRR